LAFSVRVLYSAQCLLEFVVTRAFKTVRGSRTNDHGKIRNRRKKYSSAGGFIVHTYSVPYYVVRGPEPNVAFDVSIPSFEEVRYLTEVLGWFSENLQNITSRRNMAVLPHLPDAVPVYML
jgi:hypothetical protein